MGAADLKPRHSGAGRFAIDLHTHTRFFHGRDRVGELFDPFGARLLVHMARRRGLDGVALTNHDYCRCFDLNFPLLPGIEVSTTGGHVLIIGPDPPDRTEPGVIDPHDAVELAHDRGCVAIIAHPYRKSDLRESHAAFDAVELNGKHPEFVDEVRQLADRRGIPIIGGSDAHYPVEVGRAFTLVDADEPSPAAVVEAIRAGGVEPRVREGPLTRAIRRGYDTYHRLNGHLDR